MKFCPACSTRKPQSDFYRNAKSADGLLSICKECHKSAMKRNRRENPAVRERDSARAKLPHRRAKATADVKRWRSENPDLYQAQNAINNAVRDGKLKRGSRCADCGATKKVFGLPADPLKPLDRVIWRCALCHHRGRFIDALAADVPPGTALIVIDTFNSKEKRA